MPSQRAIFKIFFVRLENRYVFMNRPGFVVIYKIIRGFSGPYSFWPRKSIAIKRRGGGKE